MSKKIKKQVEENELIKRILDVKVGFYIHNYMAIYESRFGQQSTEQKTLIHQVWNLRKTDAMITKNFEVIKNSLKINAAL